jgi:hypothetical protein
MSIISQLGQVTGQHTFEKEAALWNKLLRTGQLNFSSLVRLLKGTHGEDVAMGKVIRMGKPFPFKGGPSVSTTLPKTFTGTTITSPSLVKKLQDDVIRAIRKAQTPAKPYAPMNDILKQLAKTRKAKGKMAPSSMLDKDLFRSLKS